LSGLGVLTTGSRGQQPNLDLLNLVTLFYGAGPASPDPDVMLDW
jgi:hypothetical protein